MKKIMSIVVVFAMLLSLSISAFAVGEEKVTDVGGDDNYEEKIGLELVTENGVVQVSYAEDKCGYTYFWERVDEDVRAVTRVIPGSGYYERLVTDNTIVTGQASDFIARAATDDCCWETVSFADKVSVTANVAATTNRTTRDLGYMHYYNQTMNEVYSIFCYVNEWYNAGKSVYIDGVYASFADVATFLVGAIGLPASIASGFVANLAVSGLLLIVGELIKAADRTEVTATEVEQRIYGNCTSHSGKPTGDLGEARIIYVSTDSPRYAGETFYEGYTVRHWGTDALGRAMFWRVFGVEYTPTSWTGVNA